MPGPRPSGRAPAIRRLRSDGARRAELPVVQQTSTGMPPAVEPTLDLEPATPPPRLFRGSGLRARRRPDRRSPPSPARGGRPSRSAARRCSATTPSRPRCLLLPPHRRCSGRWWTRWSRSAGASPADGPGAAPGRQQGPPCRRRMAAGPPCRRPPPQAAPAPVPGRRRPVRRPCSGHPAPGWTRGARRSARGSPTARADGSVVFSAPTDGPPTDGPAATVQRFGLPSMPKLPSVPSLPSMPSLPSVPSMPSLPSGLPSLPNLPIGLPSCRTCRGPAVAAEHAVGPAVAAEHAGLPSLPN